MHTSRLQCLALTALFALAAVTPARALVLGGGPVRTDCFAAWEVTTADRGPNKGKVGIDCQDGDPTCDVDGAQNGVCTLGISVCGFIQGVAGCTPADVTAIKLNKLGIQVPVLPLVAQQCGPASVVPLSLRVNRKGKQMPSKRITLRLTATATRKDRDTLKVRCVPNTGAGQCPANPAGGPRELSMIVAASGTDLDNGFSGLAHDFPVPGGSQLRMCLAGCGASSNPACVEDEAATAQVKSATFGPPVPLFAAGIPTCIVNRFADTNLTGGAANLQTGAMTAELHLLSDVFLSAATSVCPRCSAAVAGQTGTCDGGRRAGQACRTQSILEVPAAAGNKQYQLSADCPPTGAPAGTLTLQLPLTTETSTLSGPTPCGAAANDGCGDGTCNATCTGNACVATTSAGQCVDRNGGLSQVCCSSATDLPCFPTGPGSVGAIVRTGNTTAPAPPFPDPTLPKSNDFTLVSTFCEAATGSITVDSVAGLRGPGALILPVTGTWLP